MTSYTQYDDTLLISLIKQGKEKAFAELYERYAEQMAKYVLKVIRSEEEAKDIVQEVFVSIWKRREVLDIKGAVIAYLLRSVRNLSIRYIEQNLDKANFLEKLAANFPQTEAITAEHLIELQDLEAKINKAVELLPLKMKEVYLLSRMENLSHKEIAAQLGIAETTVKKQVNNALKVIKTEIGGNLSITALFYLGILLSSNIKH